MLKQDEQIAVLFAHQRIKTNTEKWIKLKYSMDINNLYSLIHVY